MKQRHMYSGALAAMLMLLALPAYADGTAAGTPVNNTAAITFTLGTDPQTTQNSNTESFLVDRKVDLTVNEVDGDYRRVVNGDTNEYLTFEVTNTGNSVQDFLLTVNTTGIADPHGAATNAEWAGATAYVDSNGNDVYDVGVDDELFITGLAPDTSETVFVVVTPIPGVTDDVSAHQLVATAAGSIDGTGAYVDPTTAGVSPPPAAAETGGADNAAFIDTVFTDSSGGFGGTDGADADTDAFLVVNAQMTITKTYTVIGGGKAIPGAFIQYVITVENNTPDDATGVTATDDIPADTTFDRTDPNTSPGTIYVRQGGGSLTQQTDALGDDNGGWDEFYAGPGATGKGRIVVDLGNIAAGGLARFQFNVSID